MQDYAAVAMGVLGSVGYNGLLAVQSANVIHAIKIMYFIIPIISLSLLPIIYHFYKLDKIYPQVMEDLQIRERDMNEE